VRDSRLTSQRLRASLRHALLPLKETGHIEPAVKALFSY
jgi:hypothetical protein